MEGSIIAGECSRENVTEVEQDLKRTGTEYQECLLKEEQDVEEILGKQISRNKDRLVTLRKEV